MKRSLLLAVVVVAGACASEKSETSGTSTDTAGETAAKAGDSPAKTPPAPAAKPAAPTLDPDYAADIKSICNADTLSGADKVKDPSERVQTMVTWLRANLKTDEAKKLLQSFASMAPDSREGMLRGEARKAGLEGCAMADSGGK